MARIARANAIVSRTVEFFTENVSLVSALVGKIRNHSLLQELCLVTLTSCLRSIAQGKARYQE